MQAPTLHTRHDPLLVAAFAGRDLSGVEAEAARELVDSCTHCALLHADLVTIAAATKDLPAAVRSRDFAISPERAQRLRPTSLRRLVAAFGAPRFSSAAPLGGALATLGLAGLLLGTVPAATAMSAGVASTGARDTAASPAAASAMPKASPLPDRLEIHGGAGPTIAAMPTHAPAPEPSASTLQTARIGSLAFIVGLLLIGLRLASRRLG